MHFNQNKKKKPTEAGLRRPGGGNIKIHTEAEREPKYKLYVPLEATGHNISFWQPPPAMT